MDKWTEVATLDEIPPGGLRVIAGDEEILLARDGERVVALEYLCSHQDMPLEGGRCLDGSWVCPHHGARFELGSGRALSMPATGGVRVFATRIRDGRVHVWVGPPAADTTGQG